MAKSKKSASPATPSAAKPRAKKSAKGPESAPAAAAPAKAKATPEQIGARAHAIWVAEGRPEGKSIEHWLRAERELGS